ncbi:MAG: glycosyl hydrolase, partial [Bacteroidaceae bacterium]
MRLTASVAFLFCLILGLQAAQTKETVSRVTSSITISEALEYHITASENCIADGATIDITNLDAWIVFDNVQPASVISDWMSKVTVNGQALVANTNCFINVYKQGAAILPHGANYEPLTVYTGELYAGEAKSFKPGKYTALGTTFNNAIKSLKIKRGYMVTVAQSSTGAGYSRVFMAHDSDIEISNLADSKQCTNGSVLYNKISFIRVSRLNMPDKKGTIRPGDPNDLNCSWYYTYDCGTGSGTTNAEFVPQFHHVGWNSWAATGSQSDISGITQALGFNEPWNSDDDGYMGTNPYVCVPYQYEAVKTGRRVGTMAPTDGHYGNLYSFVDSCDQLGLRLDFVVVHYYRSQSALNGNASSFIGQIKAIHDRTKRPIWITEFNNGANWTNEYWPADSLARLAKQKLEFGAMCDALNSAPYVERYAVYQDVQNFRMMKINGVLTPAGEYYKSMKPGFAYNSAYEYIPTLPKAWNYITPTVTLNKANLTRNGQVTLTYKEQNEGYFDRCVLERKIGKGDFVKINEFTDAATTSYKDQLNKDSLRTTTYRFSCYYNNVTIPKYTFTEAISFNEAEVPPVRFGVAKVGELDFSTVSFEEFTDAGEVLPIVGAIPTTAAISVPFVYGVNPLVGTNNFRFKLAPWGYTYNYDAATRFSLAPTSPVDIPFYVASTAETSLGDLPVEAGIVSGVLDDQWINVTFKQPFAEIPVVLTSVRSDQNYVKNVAP